MVSERRGGEMVSERRGGEMVKRKGGGEMVKRKGGGEMVGRKRNGEVFLPLQATSLVNTLLIIHLIPLLRVIFAYL